MGRHGNHAISQSPPMLSFENNSLVLNVGGPNDKFGIRNCHSGWVGGER